MAFKSEMTLFTRIDYLARIGFTARYVFFFARNGFLAEIAVQQKMLYGQKYFCQIWSGFLARNGFFDLNAFSKWICLTSQSIERFGSPLMAESFQACFFIYFFKYQIIETQARAFWHLLF